MSALFGVVEVNGQFLPVVYEQDKNDADVINCKSASREFSTHYKSLVVTDSEIKENKEFSERVRPAMMSTFDAIASDVEQVCIDSGEILNNRTAMEFVLDADRISMYGGDNGRLIMAMIRAGFLKYSYDSFMMFLRKTVRLM
ncbi:hypothetical protein [Ralstonia phage RP13]|nr:hypothetical protein [Ralstonia phage RP13]BCG50285.1 hypothetical protein [Ralstonia phage RP13]